MKICIAALIFFMCAICVRAEEKQWRDVGPPFKVHGRLWVQRNGVTNPHIWVVGTKRILGVPLPEGDDPLLIPSRLRQIGWDYYIFADFTVAPLTNDEEGVMRMVRVISAENIVVTDWDLKFVRRIRESIPEELNHVPDPTLPSVTPAAGQPPRRS
jgi:hypothetical protein